MLRKAYLFVRNPPMRDGLSVTLTDSYRDLLLAVAVGYPLPLLTRMRAVL
jgi:hypothetical protein